MIASLGGAIGQHLSNVASSDAYEEICWAIFIKHSDQIHTVIVSGVGSLAKECGNLTHSADTNNTLDSQVSLIGESTLEVISGDPAKLVIEVSMFYSKL